MKAIAVYPTVDPFYHSFYLQGLIEIFGRSRIQFSSRPFPPLPSGCLAFIFRDQRELRVAVDAYDGAALTNYNRAGLEWCDVYGKVNLTLAAVPKEHAHKCLPLGPSFPVRVWGPSESWLRAVRNYRLSLDYRFMGEGINSSREHFANYRRQYKYRLPARCFTPGQAGRDYIFFSSSIWEDESAPRTNEYRSSFIACCKSLKGVTFEGGFSPSGSPGWGAKYKEYVAPMRYPLPEWLERTKASSLVFYTPAVWQSHTFKLAEYLALGKAIIAVPIVRELPSPLVHGRHIHCVDGSVDSIRSAVDLLLNDDEYRHHLEQNAFDYYTKFLTPTRVVERLLSLH